MDEIAANGKIYVSIDKLPKTTGYDREHLRRLAKAEKVDAVQVGDTWFIDPEDLQRYRTERPSRGPRK